MADDLTVTWTTAPSATGTAVSAHWGTQFKDVANDAGLGKLFIQADDPQLGDLAIGRFLRFSVGGVHRFTSRIERLSPVDVDADEEAGQVTMVQGRSLVSEWEDATVQPENGYDKHPFASTRLFGFANPYYVVGAEWNPAVEQFRQDATGVPPDELFGLPEEWYDPFIYWIWSDSPPASGVDRDPGTSYFIKDFTIPGTGVGVYRWAGAGDNKHRLFIDGIEVAGYDGPANEGWTRMYDGDIELTSGISHRCAAVVENVFSPSNNWGFLWGLWENAGTDGLGDKIIESDDTWDALHYPTAVPGFTIGRVVEILLEEAQAVGDLTGWGLSFDDVDDTNSAPWPVLAEIPVQVGMDYLSVLHQFAEAWIDFDADIDSRTLHAWVKGTRGTTSGATFTIGDNITELSREQTGNIKNVAHVLFRDGHTEIADTNDPGGGTSISLYGQRRAYLSLEDFQSTNAVNEYLAEWFAVNAWPRYAVTLGIEPASGDAPYAVFDKGDTIDVEGDDLTVVSIAAQADEVGKIEWAVDVSSRAEIREQNLDRALKSKANGTVGGRALVSTPQQIGVRGNERRPDRQLRVEAFSVVGTVAVAESGSQAIRRAVRYTGLEIRSEGDGGGDTTAVLKINGATVCTVSHNAFATRDVASCVADGGPNHFLTVAITQAGGHSGVVVTPRYVVP